MLQGRPSEHSPHLPHGVEARRVVDVGELGLSSRLDLIDGEAADVVLPQIPGQYGDISPPAPLICHLSNT